MPITRVQTVTAQSAAPGAGNVTPIFASTGAGNFLVICVAATGTSPTISTPASWTQDSKLQVATLAHAVYVFPNNPGSITSVIVSLGGTIQGVAAVAMEFSGVGSFNIKMGGAGDSQTGQTIVDQFQNAPPVTNQLLLACLGFATAVRTTTSTPDYNLGTGETVSTGGAPNAKATIVSGSNPYATQPFISHSLDASVIWSTINSRWTTILSEGLVRSPDGVWVGHRA